MVIIVNIVIIFILIRITIIMKIIIIRIKIKHLNNDNNGDKKEGGKNTSMAVEVSDVSDSPAALQAVTLKQDDNDNE